MFNKTCQKPSSSNAEGGRGSVRSARASAELEEAADVGAHGDRIAEDRVRHEVVEAAQSASG